MELEAAGRRYRAGELTIGQWQDRVHFALAAYQGTLRAGRFAETRASGSARRGA